MAERKDTKDSNKEQKEQQQSKDKHPKGGKKPKSKQSTPIRSFNEKAKQAALRQSLTASTRRLQSATSDTETNRSFLIFSSFFSSFSYENIASNDPTDFIETSSISPLNQRPQLIATSSLDNNNDNTNEVLELNKSTKKIDKIVKKINTLNAENAINKTPEQQQTTNITEPQVIFLDSSHSLMEKALLNSTKRRKVIKQ